MNNIKSPCYGCNDRCVGCHGKCNSYIQYKGQVENFNAWHSSMVEQCFGLKQVKRKISK